MQAAVVALGLPVCCCCCCCDCCCCSPSNSDSAYPSRSRALPLSVPLLSSIESATVSAHTRLLGPVCVRGIAVWGELCTYTCTLGVCSSSIALRSASGWCLLFSRATLLRSAVRTYCRCHKILRSSGRLLPRRKR